MVEDEPATLRLMARLLRGLGHEVDDGRHDRRGAARRSRPGEFDLIVSDIGLPDGSGLDLMRRVVARRGPVPAIALTGYGMEEDIRRSREAGFTAHLTKPIDFTKLEAMIRQVVATGVGEDGPASPLTGKGIARRCPLAQYPNEGLSSSLRVGGWSPWTTIARNRSDAISPCGRRPGRRRRARRWGRIRVEGRGDDGVPPPGPRTTSDRRRTTPT